MSRSLPHQLAFGIWAIRPECVAGYEQRVDAVLSGRQAMEPKNYAELELMRGCDLHFFAADGSRVDVGVKPISAEEGLVAVLNVSGAIMKDDCWDTPGTTTMARWLGEFDDTPEVTGVVLNIDSPGGNGYGMLALTQQLERMQKPVVAIVQTGMACSAAYGIAAACDVVYSGSDMDEFGSIGTYVRMKDYDKADADKRGLVTHTIKATRSGAKNKDFEAALKADPSDPNDKNYTAIRENYVDPFNEHFIALVQRNRPGVKDEHDVLSGKVFMAQDALAHSLIDATGKTMRDAVEAVRQMTKQPSTPKKA